MTTDLDRFEWLRKVSPVPSRFAHAFMASSMSMCRQVDLEAREHAAFPGNPIKWQDAQKWKRRCLRCVATIDPPKRKPAPARAKAKGKR